MEFIKIKIIVAVGDLFLLEGYKRIFGRTLHFWKGRLSVLKKEKLITSLDYDMQRGIFNGSECIDILNDSD